MMTFDGLSLNRWIVAIIAIIVGLVIFTLSSISIILVVWKALPLMREFGISALSILITGSAIVAVLGYMLFTLGARLFTFSGLIQKNIRSLEAQEIVNKVFKG